LNIAGDLAAVFLGAAVTFLISVEFGLGAVVASGLVGLLGAALIKGHAVALFCGSFVGMSSPAVFGYFELVLLAGAIAALVYVLSRADFNDSGGKLGTIAFGSTIAVWGLTHFTRTAMQVGGGLLHMIRTPWNPGAKT
jgi:hypothetical protein